VTTRPHYRALAGAIALILLLALVTRLPGLVILGAPFCLALLLGLLIPCPPLPEISMELADDRIFEGGSTTLRIGLGVQSRLQKLDIEPGASAEPVSATGRDTTVGRGTGQNYPHASPPTTTARPSWVGRRYEVEIALPPECRATPPACFSILVPGRLFGRGPAGDRPASTRRSRRSRSSKPRTERVTSIVTGSRSDGEMHGDGERVLSIVPERFGHFDLGKVTLRVTEPSRLFARSASFDFGIDLEVLPIRESPRNLIRSELVRAAVGDRVGRDAREGIEFADIRPFAEGDRSGRVNWRVSQRRGALYVNLAHPERSTDLVIFVDTFTAATVIETVRLAASLAETYLEHQDRVGVLLFGGILQVIEPATGRRQLEKILHTLAGATAEPSVAQKSADTIPRRVLPRSALVLAVSPLLDARSVNALASIRGWGYELCVLEIPLPPAVPELLNQPAGEAADLLVRLERRAREARMAAHGIPVVRWSPAVGLEGALEALASYRRAARRGGSR